MVVKKNIKKEIEELISNGADVREDLNKNNSKWFYVNLRIPMKFIEEIDGILEERIGISRTGWILESIQEKLRKEKQNE